MVKKLNLEQRATGADLVAVVRNFRANSPAVSDFERRKLLKTLAKESCPQGLLLWAAMCGTIELKSVAANNRSAGSEVITALALDAEHSPWYVVSLLEREDVLKTVISEAFRDQFPFIEADSLEDLIDVCRFSDAKARWKDQIPSRGSCTAIQPELVRILWRFERNLTHGGAYMLNYDDELFNTLNDSIEDLDGVSLLTKSLLRACLRWSQMIQRGGRSRPSYDGLERYDLVEIVVAAYLTRMIEPVPFTATY